ncbi:hypothetical protein JET18_01535 [Chryseobacterium sp. L7]|uniref:Uncharacterized protein n=1 Tax=Chryseobacterium endalhagicum TaxID=2797638 RepID=A0ABS1QA68_9FLAO|nr:hypothetical protein [Chryseobacterium endalhagicum]MBL1219498.1 hypothetical protein [Chryseobacterium endalhagicum]
MKNLILKSILILGIMTFLNAGIVGETVKWIGLPPSSHTLHGFAIFIGCLIISLVSLITILIFKNSYTAIWKVAVLFEILYLLMLLWSKTNPFTYFSTRKDNDLMDLFLYVNSIGIFLLICIFDLIYSKITASEIKN